MTLNAIIANFQTFKLVDLLDIIIISFLIYQLLGIVNRTRAGQLFKGALLVMAVYLVAETLNMRTVTWLLNSLLQVGLLTLVVLFQPEIRRALERMGQTDQWAAKLFNVKGRYNDPSLKGPWRSAIIAICDAAERFSETKTGALIVLERQTNLSEIVRTGTPVVALGPLSITDQGVTIAVLYACRFALVIILGAVFLTTTTPTAMTDAFATLISPLNRLGIHAQEIALVMSLALRFIPTLTDETRAIVDAQSARGGSIETGSLAQRIKAMSAIIVPIFAGTLRHADNLSLALDARCYEEGIRRTHWRALTIAARDLIFAAAVIIYIAAIIAL